MKIKFKRIEIHNFLSYKDEAFDFEKTKGMNLITGKNLDLPGSKNGVGKSGWALALTYGLFGELPFKLNNKNIPNRYINDNITRVCVWLDSERKHYKICSGMKGRASNCSLFEIVNGKENDITKSTIAETRAYIQKEILNCDINLFMRTIFLNSDPSYNFYNLSHKDKKEFIDKLFDISLYGDMFSVIHKDNLALEKEMIAHQNKLMVLNRNSEEYIERSEEFLKNNEQEMTSLNGKLTIAQESLKEKSSKVIERNADVINKCLEIAEKLSETLSSSRMNLQKSEFNIKNIKTAISVAESKISDREKIIKKHDDLRSKLCEDCKGIFSKHYNLDSYKSDIEKLNVEIANKKNELENEIENYKSIKSKKDTAETQKNSVTKKMSDINSAYEKSKKEISEFECAVKGILDRMDNIKNSKNPYIPLIESNNANIKTETESLTELKEQYTYAKFLEDIVDQENLKKYIIKDLIGILNSKIRHYLHRLGANYDIIFDENMEYVFNTQDMTGAEFHNFSSGEQARISIATCFAFRDFLSMRSSIESNILILDEFIDSNVDSLAIENIIDILGDFSRASKQNIYLVSHRQEVGIDNFDRVIQIEKKDNISEIKYQNIKK